MLLCGVSCGQAKRTAKSKSRLLCQRKFRFPPLQAAFCQSSEIMCFFVSFWHSLGLCKVHKIAVQHFHIRKMPAVQRRNSRCNRFNGPSPLQKWCVAGVITSSIEASNFRFNSDHIGLWQGVRSSCVTEVAVLVLGHCFHIGFLPGFRLHRLASQQYEMA